MPLARPLPDDTREALKMLWDVCESQQSLIDQLTNSIKMVWHAEPSRPREGDLKFADGTDWDPGSGAGYYQYTGGIWIAL